MIQSIKISFILAFLPLLVSAQANNILGIWLTEEEDSQIRIFKSTDGKFYGKVIWMKTDIDMKDDKNPDPTLRDRKIMGLQILSNFSYNTSKKEWVNGIIYDPNNGKSYDCYMWFNDNKDILYIKGFVLGMRFLGRETTWKREINKRS